MLILKILLRNGEPMVQEKRIVGTGSQSGRRKRETLMLPEICSKKKKIFTGHRRLVGDWMVSKMLQKYSRAFNYWYFTGV